MNSKTVSATALAVALLAVCAPSGLRGGTRTVGLETCHLVRPSNVVAPVFSWKMESSEKGARQTAYRLTVKSPGGQSVWDSGEVASSASVGVRYAGPSLQSGLKYTWTVRVKDGRGDWEKAEEDIPNPGLPTARRIAVRFKKPVVEATVSFAFRE